MLFQTNPENIHVLNPLFWHRGDCHAAIEEEMRRIVAVCRFLLPDAAIRLAGGRGLLTDKGKSCFQSGANAAITGDMLTTAGITVETDLKLLKELGYAPALVEK